MKRVLLILLVVLVLAGSLVGGGLGLMMWRFTPDIPEANYPEPATPVDARLQDLDYLRRFPEADRSFSPAQLSAFNALIDDLEARAQTMSEAQFVMGVSAAGAIPENGHSGVSLRGTLNRLNSLPVRFAWFGDGLHIVRAHAQHADLIGARVAAYEGTPPEELYPQMDPYFGGNAAFLRTNSALFFAAPASLHAAGLIDQPDRVTLDLVSLNGETRSQPLSVETQKTEFFSSARIKVAKAHEAEEQSGHDWRFLDPAMTQKTWYGRSPDEVFWTDTLDLGGVYWRMRNIVADDTQTAAEWLEVQAKILRAQPAPYLVLDLRGNGGGDYTQAMSVMREIDELVAPKGRVYILTDEDTFSAAIVTAFYALHAVGEAAVLTGAPMGDNT